MTQTKLTFSEGFPFGGLGLRAAHISSHFILTAPWALGPVSGPFDSCGKGSCERLICPKSHNEEASKTRSKSVLDAVPPHFISFLSLLISLFPFLPLTHFYSVSALCWALCQVLWIQTEVRKALSLPSWSSPGRGGDTHLNNHQQSPNCLCNQCYEKTGPVTLRNVGMTAARHPHGGSERCF